MNRKFIFSIALLSFLFWGVGAQQLSAQIRFGVRGGFDVIDHKINTKILKVSNRLGYRIGGTMEILAPASGFGGDIAILYGRKEYKVEDLQAHADISNYDYISVPINVKKRFGLLSPIGIFITAGVYGDVRINGGDFNDVVDEYKAKNFAFGVNAGAGVSLFKRVDLGLYFRGELTERYSSEHLSVNTLQKKKFQSWNVGLTYFF